MEPEILGAIVGGLIGIGGSAISYVISYLLKNKGKLILFSNRSKVEYFGKVDEFGQREKIYDLNLSEDIVISIDIDLLNTSDMPKAIGEFKIELRNKDNSKLLPAIRYERTSLGLPYSTPVITTMVMPKQTENIKCDGHILKKDFCFTELFVEISLVFRTNKQKCKKIKVLDINIR